MRWGRSVCPKLFDTILAKQLDNITTPMPNGRAALGDAVCMRLHHSFSCLMEGMTLTVCYAILVVILAFGVAISSNVWLLFMAKYNAPYIVMVLWGVDFLQDIIVARGTHKFSDWSFVFLGLRSKKHVVHIYMVVCALSSAGVFAGLNVRVFTQQLGKRNAFPWNIWPNVSSLFLTVGGS